MSSTQSDPASATPASVADEDCDRAIAEFSKALELQPNAAEAFYGRGLAYQHKWAFAEALADYDRAIELAPHHADALFKRSIVHRQLGAFDKAAADFDQAVQILWRQHGATSAGKP